MTKSQPAALLAAALQQEQRYTDLLYDRLEQERSATAKALAEVHARGADGGTRQAATEREVLSDEYSRRLAQLDSVESGLCFGRIDTAEGEALYIGRIGLRTPAMDPLLVDWRAPAAGPFYTASPARPSGLVRRRHLHSQNRTVTGVDDEILDPRLLREPGPESGGGSGLVGEAALLQALDGARTGRMTDAVATIQAEQDRVIRSPLQGVLVVQGGPGTGKTVAALHRAAYLLYTHRGTLARRGVLVVGPNAVFLRYIGEVLPSLGETDVVLTSLGGLFPGVEASAEDGAATAVVKGSLRMARVLAEAVRLHQRVPDGDLSVPLDEEETGVRVPHEVSVRALRRAQALGMPHNAARKRFVTDMLAALVRARAEHNRRPLDDEELRHGPGELWRQRSVRSALDRLWPLLTPAGLVDRLLSDSALLAGAAAGLLDDAEQAALLRLPGAELTVGDVPLLDETAELLGEDDSSARARARAARTERAEEERYAREVLQILGLDESGPVEASDLAVGMRDPGAARTTANRAAADRSWAYGHVIVDEAQELSPMAWRMVMRRAPSRSMTLVGDVAQTGNAAGARSWEEVLAPHAAGRWREERLTVNYRTPAEVMEPAARVLAAVSPDQEPPESVRREGVRPRAVRCEAGALVAGAVRCVTREQAALGEAGGGKLAVIAPDDRIPALCRALPQAATGSGRAALDAEVAVLSVAQAKGLEFDRVVLADPAGILAQSPQGGHDLYVAITRVTHRLTVVHEGHLPEPLGQLDQPARDGSP
ncbi:DNA helicase IV [Streptomyces sp. WMMB 714]|uniref:HelD family protein n=1 Tax=Streptomyces sp. WMMB 714 TaxID=1286822 RepID=UPI0005F8801D|nr:AAA family ATPase [Streptomyces sp. WMMB 714]SCK42544.1 DNA helicase IV [Streptomyces sp. WMMB 714]